MSTSLSSELLIIEKENLVARTSNLRDSTVDLFKFYKNIILKEVYVCIVLLRVNIKKCSYDNGLSLP